MHSKLCLQKLGRGYMCNKTTMKEVQNRFRLICIFTDSTLKILQAEVLQPITDSDNY